MVGFDYERFIFLKAFVCATEFDNLNEYKIIDTSIYYIVML